MGRTKTLIAHTVRQSLQTVAVLVKKNYLSLHSVSVLAFRDYY